MSAERRVCKVCREAKPLTDEFYSGKDITYKKRVTRYYPHTCRVCQSTATRARYHSDPQRRASQIMHSMETGVQKKYPAAWFGSVAQEGAKKLLAATHCSYCGVPKEQGWGFSLDHHVPLALGGTHTLDNLYPACEPCNRAKHDMPPADFKRWMDGLVWRLAWLRAE